MQTVSHAESEHSLASLHKCRTGTGGQERPGLVLVWLSGMLAAVVGISSLCLQVSWVRQHWHHSSDRNTFVKHFTPQEIKLF